MASDLVIPQLMQHRLLQLGEIGAGWLERLDTLLNTLQQRWQVTVREQLHGGTEALVLLCTYSAESPRQGLAVLKLGIPGSLMGEIRTLQLARGSGYVEAICADSARDALLMPRLGSRLADLPLSVTAQIQTICATLHLAWRRLDDAGGLRSGAQQAVAQRQHIESAWQQLQPDYPTKIRDRAVEYSRLREAADHAGIRRLVHGDAHIWNTLQDPQVPGQFKFVDPEGLYAEPALDLGISMREWKEDLLDGDTLQIGRGRCALLADLTGVDADAIWQWGFIEHVACGLLDLQLGDNTAADQHLTIASYWLAQP